jgi:hypothetical protein
MEVNFIEASDMLKSALERIENHPDGMDSYYIDYMNLVDIQGDLERVELFLNGMKTGNILKNE